MDESLLSALQDLQSALRLQYTAEQANLLRSRVMEYRMLLGKVPDELEKVKNKNTRNLRILLLKMDAIFQDGNSLQASRFYYKDTVNYLMVELDDLIEALRERLSNSSAS
jgi:hypothetical protein